MNKFLLLKQAAIESGHPEYRLRKWIWEKKIRFTRAGNRYLLNLQWLTEDLEKMGTENTTLISQDNIDYGKIRKIHA